MIVVIYGTTGELIKLYPVLQRFREREIPFLQISTGQQVLQIPRFLEIAGLPPVDVWLGRGRRGRDLRANRDIPPWALRVAATFARERGRLRRRVGQGPGDPLVLVHGDTMTTLYAALLGRLLRYPVAHIESGLRSFDLLHPFPEELNRRLTSRIARVLYAPGAWAASNLRWGDVVDTGSNTIRDALDLAVARPASAVPIDGGPDVGIVSLHRFELLKDGRLLAATVEALSASDRRLLWIDHPVTVSALEHHGLTRVMGPNITRVPRLDFFGFVSLMRQCGFLVTDSGGSQEEAYYLDIPCLVHRKRTERREGLGENVVVSEFDLASLSAFLRDPSRWRRLTPLPASRPSDVIVEDLVHRGFALPDAGR